MQVQTIEMIERPESCSVLSNGELLNLLDPGSINACGAQHIHKGCYVTADAMKWPLRMRLNRSGTFYADKIEHSREATPGM